MNIRRGFFRLWLVLSLPWVVGCGALLWPDVLRDRAWQAEPEWLQDAILYVPVRCEAARGATPADYVEREAHEPWNKHRVPNTACWYEQPRFRQLWPEYADLDQDALLVALYERLGWEQQAQPDPFLNTKRAALTMLGPPLSIFLLGAMLAWAFAGFRPKPSP